MNMIFFGRSRYGRLHTSQDRSLSNKKFRGDCSKTNLWTKIKRKEEIQMLAMVFVRHKGDNKKGQFKKQIEGGSQDGR